MRLNQFKFILIIVVVLLSIPFVASFFSTNFNWSWFDYTIMGILLLLVGITATFLFNSVKNQKRRLLYFILLGIVVFVIWAELAVGVFNTVIAGD